MSHFKSSLNINFFISTHCFLFHNIAQMDTHNQQNASALSQCQCHIAIVSTATPPIVAYNVDIA